MEPSAFTDSACKGRTAVEFRPKKGLKLDLAQIAQKLSAGGIEVLIETPVLLILQNRGKEITLSRGGKILVKGTKDRPIAREAVKAVIDVI